MHISRTVITTIALAATGSALPASSCGSGTCPHNGGGSNSRVAGGDNQGNQQGQQGQQRFDKTRQNGESGVAPRSHNLVFAGHPAESGNQMGGNGNTGLYDKSDNYFGKKEFDHDKLQLSASSPAGLESERLTGISPIGYSKEQQFQPRSEVSSEIRKTNDGQRQQQQGQESRQLMTTLDKIREILFGSQQQQQQQQQQQKFERQQEGKGNTHIRRSEIQGQGSTGTNIQGQAGHFESGTYDQSGLGQERQRLRGGDLEQPLLNNVEGKDGLTEGQRGTLRMDRGDGRQSSNGQVVQRSVGTGNDKQHLAMKGKDTLNNNEVPTIVISQHEKVQPRGQGQSSSKGSSSTNSEETDNSKVFDPAQMLEKSEQQSMQQNKEQQSMQQNREQQSMQQNREQQSMQQNNEHQSMQQNNEHQSMQQNKEQPSSGFLGSGGQLLNKGDNNQGRLAGRNYRAPNAGTMDPNPIAEKNDGSTGTSEEEEGDEKAEKVLGSSDLGKQWGQTEAELTSCLYLAGQQGDISMLRDCFNNDASKMQNPLQEQQQQRLDGITEQQRLDGITGQQSQGKFQDGKAQA